MADRNILFLGLTLKDLLIAGGWLLTIFGWFISGTQANNREIRKEIRSEVDACCKMVSDLLVKARVYYSSPPTDPLEQSRASEISFDLQRLITRIERLEKRYSQFEMMGAGSELMDSLTGGDFATADRKLETANSDLMQKIESDIHFLIDRLEDGFYFVFK